MERLLGGINNAETSIEGSNERKMEKAIAAYSREFASIRAGRANASLYWIKFQVDYYGAPTPFNQMAGISVPEARYLSFNLMIKRSMVILKKRF